ncbi:MAG: aminoacetone oxidase family FAD-binding enzyme [Candidatus Omnitrophica bacterium]|nr:aminoacetone oxidase family FAD-binding enzyme [Candidatus Omnitrophota bacterium]
METAQLFWTDAAGTQRTEQGELLFTHYGLSGPLVLDSSADWTALLRTVSEILVKIDCRPDQDLAAVEKMFAQAAVQQGSVQIKNVMQDVVPKRLALAMLRICGIMPEKKIAQLAKQERRDLAALLKAFPLTVTAPVNTEDAMVTAGGIARSEINPRTMESRRVPGLYFAGEIIDGCGCSGGYNLQQAFATGYLAAEGAVAALPRCDS